MAVYRLLDSLAGVEPGDPRVAEAARALAACVPAELVPEGADFDASDSFLRAFYADFAPAQAEAIRWALRIVAESPS